jgi:hypothetical protein
MMQLLAIVVTCFTIGSIFFLRGIMVIWVCTEPETPGGPQFLVSQPKTECNTEHDEYAYLNAMTWLGLIAYVACFVTFAAGASFKRDLFNFMGDKFEAVRTFICKAWQRLRTSFNFMCMLPGMVLLGVDSTWTKDCNHDRCGCAEYLL